MVSPTTGAIKGNQPQIQQVRQQIQSVLSSYSTHSPSPCPSLSDTSRDAVSSLSSTNLPSSYPFPYNYHEHQQTHQPQSRVEE